MVLVLPENEQQNAGGLAGQLLGRGLGMGARSFFKELQGRREANKMSQAFQQVQDIYSDPSLSDRARVLGVYSVLHKNPSFAQQLLTSLSQADQRDREAQSGQGVSRGLEAIYEDDEDSLRDVFRDPRIPGRTKERLAGLQEKRATRRSVQGRELRSRLGQVTGAYKDAISNARKDLKQARGKAAIDGAHKRIKELEVLQKKDLVRLKKDPEAYRDLSLWSTLGLDVPDEGMGMAGASESSESLLNNLSDAQVDQLFKESGGDLERAKQLALQRHGR